MLHFTSSWYSPKSHILDTDKETNQTDTNLDFFRNGVLKRMSLLLNLNLKHQNTCLKKRMCSTLLIPSKYQECWFRLTIFYILSKVRFSSLMHRCPSRVRLQCLNSVGFHAFNDFHIILVSNLLIMSVPYEDYSKYVSCSKSIFVFPY
jgi:hypothetical protein